MSLRLLEKELKARKANLKSGLNAFNAEKDPDRKSRYKESEFEDMKYEIERLEEEIAERKGKKKKLEE